MTRILALSGSVRTGSVNTQLLRVAAKAVEEAGAAVTVLNLRDYELPLYDGDLEAAQGIPQAALDLKAQFAAHDGLLIACPEYNGSITPLLKNTIDWLSRPADGEAPLAAFDGKVAGLIAASPGALGGLRGLRHVREILSGIRVHVIPDQVAVGSVHKVLTDDGISDERTAGMLRNLAVNLVRTTGALA